MTLERWLALATAVSLLAFVALWLLVVRQRGLRQLDVASTRLRGRATGLARVLTASGRAPALAALSVVAVVAAYAMRVPLIVPAAVIVSQLVSQVTVELIKSRVRRARPDEWVAYHDLGFSFPSGHATTAVVFFGTLAALVATAPVAFHARTAAAVALGVWAIGIDWSRMALGAHYASDVLGGTFFGLACSCATLALLAQWYLPA